MPIVSAKGGVKQLHEEKSTNAGSGFKCESNYKNRSFGWTWDGFIIGFFSSSSFLLSSPPFGTNVLRTVFIYGKNDTARVRQKWRFPSRGRKREEVEVAVSFRRRRKEEEEEGGGGRRRRAFVIIIIMPSPPPLRRLSHSRSTDSDCCF